MLYLCTYMEFFIQATKSAAKITPSIFDMKNYKPPVTTTDVPSAITIYHHYISKF